MAFRDIVPEIIGYKNLLSIYSILGCFGHKYATFEVFFFYIFMTKRKLRSLKSIVASALKSYTCYVQCTYIHTFIYDE